MTAKSRRRKRDKHPIMTVEKRYIFQRNSWDVTISAATLYSAKQKFQEQYGYWPDKEYNHGNDHPPTQTGAA